MGELRSASVALAEIIAYIKQTRQTGRLLIRIPNPDSAAPAPAVLIFESGHLIDARQESASGDDLVYRLLAQRDANYSFDRLPEEQLPPGRNISRVQELLVRAAIGILTEEEAAPAPAPPVPAHPPHTNGDAALTPPPPPVPRPYSFRRRNTIPLPAGTLTYVVDPPPDDFSTFLDSVEQDHLSGYITWVTTGAEGLLLVYQGQVIDARWAEAQPPATYAERAAMQRFAAAAAAGGRRHIEVHVLAAAFVHSYAALTYGTSRAGEQGLTRVDLPALIARLTAGRHTGSVKVVAGQEAAYLFLAGGRIVGEYRVRPGALEPAPGCALELLQELGSRVDVFTAPAPADLISLNAAAWPVARVATELGRAAQEVLGAKARPVLDLLATAGSEPQALQAACTRAKQVTWVFLGPEKHAELSRRLDRLLVHLPLTGIP